MLVDDFAVLFRVFKVRVHGSAVGNRDEVDADVVHPLLKFLWLVPVIVFKEGTNEGFDITVANLPNLSKSEPDILGPRRTGHLRTYSNLVTRGRGDGLEGCCCQQGAANELSPCWLKHTAASHAYAMKGNHYLASCGA